MIFLFTNIKYISLCVSFKLQTKRHLAFYRCQSVSISNYSFNSIVSESPPKYLNLRNTLLIQPMKEFFKKKKLKINCTFNLMNSSTRNIYKFIQININSIFVWCFFISYNRELLSVYFSWNLLFLFYSHLILKM